MNTLEPLSEHISSVTEKSGEELDVYGSDFLAFFIMSAV